jgi:hypothetical protein
VGGHHQIYADYEDNEPDARNHTSHRLPIVDIGSFVSIVIGGYKIKVKRPVTIIIIAGDVSRPQPVAPITHFLIVIIVNIKPYIFYFIGSVVAVCVDLNLPFG